LSLISRKYALIIGLMLLLIVSSIRIFNNIGFRLAQNDAPIPPRFNYLFEWQTPHYQSCSTLSGRAGGIPDQHSSAGPRGKPQSTPLSGLPPLESTTPSPRINLVPKPSHGNTLKISLTNFVVRAHDHNRSGIEKCFCAQRTSPH
jgi:hypothetical protein